jgi:HAD superfamily hydrolase (TIGR01458 family)
VALSDVRGVLLDIDGVLTVSWRPLPGAVDAVAWLKRRRVPFLLMTNTTSHTRAALADRLRGVGFEVDGDDVVTAPVATAAYLRTHHPRARCFLLGAADVADDLAGVDLVDESADVVVVAGADPAFTWENVNRAFRMVVGGAALVAMHRNLSWMTEDGLTLDSGAYVAGLEQAAGVEAVVCGKPAPEFFRQAIDLLNLSAEATAMVGDDVETDVLAAQAVGLTGVLVETGKFRAEALERATGRPDHVIDSVGDLPDLLEVVSG